MNSYVCKYVIQFQKLIFIKLKARTRNICHLWSFPYIKAAEELLYTGTVNHKIHSAFNRQKAI